MTAITLRNVDKSRWVTLPFGEIARSIGERVDPTTTDLATYVGLEHIDPESIHIKRFGEREDVSGTKLRCYPGDIIFGRRRAYQRKAAICEFDGFCSAHSLVLRAIPDVIDPKLFPFFLHSDQFMHRAVDISVGGLSPTINWTKLKNEEFLIPPKDQQAKLAELLWAADRNVGCVLQMESRISRAKSALMVKLKKMYFDKSIKSGCEDLTKGRVDDFFVLQRGFDLTKKNAISGEVPVISSSGFSYFHNEAKCEAPGVVTGRKGKLGDVYFLNEPHWPHDTSLWVKDFRNSYPKFVYWFLKSIDLDSFNAATAVPTLNRNVIHPLNVIFPCSKCQKSTSQKLDAVAEHLTSIESHKGRAGSLLKSLINQIF